ncbi:arylsulfatase B-like isoform X1 [Ornithodoros turicata]|uniref:arylsulfatase B-like isoform X1 n=1 Tax=Ornithodoros turicata TaxID=34597 RepID=UPI0031393281
MPRIMDTLLLFPLKDTTTFLLFYLCFSATTAVSSKSPHIIFILADDLGWNDVSYHGCPQIPTGNIDAMAWNGLRLTQYYTQTICSPSRAALMTGRYPIRTGMQHFVLDNREERGLPLDQKLLPEWLAELGYTNYLVGKWHLGFHKEEYTPTRRGFHHHFGFWGSNIDYYNHTSAFPKAPQPLKLDSGKSLQTINWTTGMDYRSGPHILWNYTGLYSTDVFTSEAVRIIGNHPVEKPLFLCLSHGAPHSGDMRDPLQVPDSYTSDFKDIGHEKRIKFAGMVKALDISVGEVFHALDRKGMLENSVVVFSSDNGPDLERIISNYGSAWPLRGQKETPWEGGVRSPAVVWSPLLNTSSRVTYDGLVHITDWLPTFYHLAGGNVSNLEKIDGVNNWNAFLKLEPPQRTELLVNIDQIEGYAAIRDGKFKLVKGGINNGRFDVWYPILGNVPWSSTQPRGSCESSVVKHVISRFRRHPVCGSDSSSYATPIQCGVRWSNKSCDATTSPCLFDLSVDPCEYNDISKEHAEVVQSLMTKLSQYQSESLPPGNRVPDPKSDPVHHDGLWTNWADIPSLQEVTPQQSSATETCSFLSSAAFLFRAVTGFFYWLVHMAVDECLMLL